MSYKSGLKIGFLGGGQLARMMVQACHELGLIPYVMSSNKNDPAAQVTAHWVCGDVYSANDLIEFLKQVDVATFESEFLNAKVLTDVQNLVTTPIIPKPQLMGELQDRLTQKKLLVKYKLKTSPFREVSNYDHALEAMEHFQFPFVLKQRHHGYDGYGTFVIKSKKDLINIQEKLDSNPYGFIAEAFVPFKRELAISAVRNKKGEVVFLPLVESKQVDSRCLWVKGPIKHKQLSSLQKNIKQFLNSLGYVGIIAFELFETPSGLWVNEIAPRVHNSAHYSQNALDLDQFKLHVLSLINEPLRAPRLNAEAFAMYNLLAHGPSQSFKFTNPPDVYLHWYGKGEARPGRKMGHINCLAQTPDKALKVLSHAIKEFKI